MGKDAAAENEGNHACGNAPVAAEDALQNEVVASSRISAPALVNPDNEDPGRGEEQNQLRVGEALFRDAFQAPQEQGTQGAAQSACNDGE